MKISGVPSSGRGDSGESPTGWGFWQGVKGSETSDSCQEQAAPFNAGMTLYPSADSCLSAGPGRGTWSKTALETTGPVHKDGVKK